MLKFRFKKSFLVLVLINSIISIRTNDWRILNKTSFLKLSFLGFLSFGLLLFAAPLFAQQIAVPKPERIWEMTPNLIPDHDTLSKPDEPKIYVYLPSAKNTTKSAVMIFPGGSYSSWAASTEGFNVARFLNTQGIAAFVVYYRNGTRYHYPVQLLDAQRALRLVRSRAQQYGIDPQRIGVMGFSAGGHLAALTSTHFDLGNLNAEDPVDRVSSRPNFSVLVYPVITFTNGPYIHRGSRTNLTGGKTDLYEELSPELHVTKETPPAFLVHGDKDGGVQADNSVLYYLACRRAGVPAELHVFQNASHSFHLGNHDPAVSEWPKLLTNWMSVNGWIPSLDTVVIAAGDTEPAKWWYTTTMPLDGWQKPGFDVSGWDEGKSGFGSPGTPGITISTEWKTSDIWLVRDVIIPASAPRNLGLWLYHDDGVEVYLNGAKAMEEGGNINHYQRYEVSDAAKAILKPKTKIRIALHTHQDKGGQGIDLGIITLH